MRHAARWVAIAVGVGGLLVAGMAVPATSAHADAPATAIVDGSVTWGVRSSFRSYITGPIAHGSIDAGNGATVDGSGVGTFPVVGGSITATGSHEVVEGTGWLRFRGHDGQLELALSEPRVVLSGDRGNLIVDVTSRSLAGGPAVSVDDVVFATLDLSSVAPVVEAQLRRWTAIPATLTEEGASAFSGFYPAGTPLDPVSVEAVVESRSGEEPPPPPAGGGGEDPPPPPDASGGGGGSAPIDGPGGSRSALGPNGQQLTVTPARGLDPAGATVRVEGAGYDPSVGVYLAMCVDQGPALPPSPCFGGADTSGESRSAVWFSNSPPPYAAGLTRPFGAGGSFEAELEIAAMQRDETGAVVIDCLDPSTRCVIATRADHTRPADRSADVKVPVSFAGQEDPGPGVDDPPSPAPPTLELDRLQVTPGELLSVSGRGFLAGEQVELLLYSTPRWVSTPVADPTGAIEVVFTVPVDLEPGEHHLEARGVSSGLTARSPSFMVVTATPAENPEPPAATVARAAGGMLPRTGGGAGLAPLGVVLVAAGGVLTTLARTQRRRIPDRPR